MQRGDAGVRVLRWGVTVAVLAAGVVAWTRVGGCLGDPRCTFAPRALDAAVLTFVAGPLAVAAAWVVPIVVRRRGPRPGRWVGLVAAGAAAFSLGLGASEAPGRIGLVLVIVGVLAVVGGAAGVLASGSSAVGPDR